MKNEWSEDIGEKIIFKLKTIIDKLDKILKNEKELPNTFQN